MSFKLNHNPVAGESYVRCHQVVIDNRHGKTPVITFHRERVIGTDTGTLARQPLSPKVMAFDPAASVPLVDPDTGTSTGQSMTHADVYAALYSAFVAVETATPDTGDV